MTQLTEREQQILEMICQGLEIKQIADMLVCSITTIKFHRSNIIEKMQVTNMYQAVSIYQKTYTKV